MLRPDFFLLVDLRDFFFQIKGQGTEKSSENDQLTGHFQSFFFSFSEFFFLFISIISPGQTVKLVK